MRTSPISKKVEDFGTQATLQFKNEIFAIRIFDQCTMTVMIMAWN